MIKMTHCPQGHEFTPSNTGRQRETGRYCKTCRKSNSAAWQAENAECKKWYWKKQKYGITKETFEREIAAQNRCCAVCRKPFSDEKGLEPVIDHNHKTGGNRGILHRKCNMAIGLLQDDSVTCKLAGEYLEKYNGR